MMKFCTYLLVFLCLTLATFAQPSRWQQRVKYLMKVEVDDVANSMKGSQVLEYWNNSPDTLKKVYYHLYWNAFQPNSMMDVRSQELGKSMISGKQDWDSRIKNRIANLKANEIGSQKILSLKMNDVDQPFKYHETILEVLLIQPILPGVKVNLTMQFETQIPIQIRRSGRDNLEGVRYSMSQWYPKICEYDYEGWHPTPYIAREFYGVWGDYDVSININKNYKLAGSGVLQNAAEIGWGYDKPGTSLKNISSLKRNWRFIANNVHDFVWAADPNYGHIVKKIGNLTIHVVHKQVDSTKAQWELVADAAVIVHPFIEKKFGKYPYPQYSFIQGGDGGMEYPMATLMNRPSIGLAFHEWMHSWYQMMLGTNESLYGWMDEGFTGFADNEVAAFYQEATSKKVTQSSSGTGPRGTAEPKALPLNHAASYSNYFALARSGREEPLTTHADHFNTNFGFSFSTYSKGEVFLVQLGYIVGEEIRNKILLEYYRQWRFKHPNVNDFMRIAENVSGLKLDWYKNYWIYSTKTIDYGIDSLWEEKGQSKIRLRRVGLVPMPIDLELRLKDGSTETHYIPLGSMFGEKPIEGNEKRTVHQEWSWTHPTYTLTFPQKLRDLKELEIDPSNRMADIERRNNLLELKW